MNHDHSQVEHSRTLYRCFCSCKLCPYLSFKKERTTEKIGHSILEDARERKKRREGDAS